MSQELIVTLIGAILGSSVLGSIITYLFMKPKIAAETSETNAKAASEQVDTTQKTSDFIEKMQNKNVDLYELTQRDSQLVISNWKQWTNKCDV
jgi:hypothetical protein